MLLHIVMDEDLVPVGRVDLPRGHGFNVPPGYRVLMRDTQDEEEISDYHLLPAFPVRDTGPLKYLN